MDDPWQGWPREKRQLPAHLVAVAAAHPGGGVEAIDGSVVEDPNGYVPPEAIVGVFLVGPDGRATGDYARNPQHGPVQDDFAKLGSPDDWAGWVWLPDTPGRWDAMLLRKASRSRSPGRRWSGSRSWKTRYS